MLCRVETIGGNCWRHKSGICSLAFSTSGEYLAAVSVDGTVIVYLVRTGEVYYEYAHPEGLTHCVCFAPTNNRLLVASDNGTVSLHDIDTRVCLASSFITAQIKSVSFDDDNLILVICDDGFRRLTEDRLSPAMEIPCLESFGVNVAVEPNVRLLVTTSFWGNLRIWDIVTAKPRMQLSADISDGAAIAMRGGRIACANGEYGIRIWNLITGEMTVLDHELLRYVRAIGFSDDASVLGAVNYTGSATLWSTEDWTRCITVNGNPVVDSAIAFTRDDRLAALANTKHRITVCIMEKRR